MSDHAALTARLNALLTGLLLPIELESPFDLTPNLLIAILESLNRERLPIDGAVRASRDIRSKKIAMMVFLGVLETDVIQEDVGISMIDPHRLARGEENETIYIAQLLAWLAGKLGFVEEQAANSREHSPSTRSNSVNTSLLSLSARHLASSDTSVTDGASTSFSSARRPATTQPLPTSSRTVVAPLPRCIHEVTPPEKTASTASPSLMDDSMDGFEPENASFAPADASFMPIPRERSPSKRLFVQETSMSFCECSRHGLDPSQTHDQWQHTFSRSPPRRPVRLSGDIAHVDDTFELSQFENSRNRSSPRSRDPTIAPRRAYASTASPRQSITESHANRTFDLLKTYTYLTRPTR